MQPVLAKLDLPVQASFRAFVKDERRAPFLWHYHAEYELTYIVRGRGRRFVGDDVADYRAGDLVFLGSYLPHTWQSAGRYRAIVVQFARDFMGDALEVCPEMRPIRQLLGRGRRGLKILGRARTRIAGQLSRLIRSTDIPRLVQWLRVLDQLAAAPQYQVLASEVFSAPRGAVQSDGLRAALDEIHRHFLEPLRQMDVAERAGLSTAAFSRFFRRATGIRFVDYVIDLRVGHACQLLLETDLPMTQISHESGFANLSNFNRAFRQRRGMTPSEFRNTYVGEERGARSKMLAPTARSAN
jgi:AraC-like DNA-binding protein